jgi:hypothetical protein
MFISPPRGPKRALFYQLGIFFQDGKAGPAIGPQIAAGGPIDLRARQKFAPGTTTSGRTDALRATMNASVATPPLPGAPGPPSA